MTTPTAGSDEKPAASDAGRCARCGAAFGCGMLAGAERCWCADLPALGSLPSQYQGQGCLCPDCLKALLD